MIPLYYRKKLDAEIYEIKKLKRDCVERLEVNIVRLEKLSAEIDKFESKEVDRLREKGL